LSEFSDCQHFEKEQVEKIHNQKILIVAGFFLPQKRFQTSKVRTKTHIFSKKNAKNASEAKKTSHNQNFLIVDFLNLFFFENVATIRKF